MAETPEYKNIWENSQMLSLRRLPGPAGCAVLMAVCFWWVIR